MAEVLGAIRRLAGADFAQIVSYRPRGVDLEALAQIGTLNGFDVEQLASGIRSCEQRFEASDRRCWIEDDRSGSAGLIVRLSERSAQVFWLVLGFRVASDKVRLRSDRMAAEFATLVKASLEQQWRLDTASDRTAATATALDHGECGMIAVRADHSVAFCNSVGQAMLAAERGLQLRRGALRPTDYTSGARFYAALEAATTPLPPGDATPPRAFMMLLPSGQEARPMIVVVTPMSRQPDAKEASTDAAAIVYLLQPGHGKADGLDTLCQLLGLSRVETRLMAHLYAGRTISEAALQMRIKVDTARAYLKQIFAKTDTHRQSDLVALLTRYLRAARGNFDFRAA